jgi:hypothetical protein
LYDELRRLGFIEGASDYQGPFGGKITLVT